ncbi:MAG: TetR/AcrR family transcriptional regulator [Mycobacteriaceae bacterium]|nr:TetR/AcrR family transcriptional regulator [Mycobacteriaceae bacterium]
MTEPNEKRADLTRRQILHAAAHQFAHRPYSQVSLDDILENAAVTKGAMYFHFRSKHALALAIIDEQTHNGRTAANAILGRRLSGLETMVDLLYLVAAQDLSDNVARAAMNLVESVGRADGIQIKLLGQWIAAFATVLQRAISEGDIRDDVKPEVGGRLLVALYMGLRQTSELSDSHKFFSDLEEVLLLTLTALAQPDRIAYITQFIKRRTAIAVNSVPLRSHTP